MSNEIASITKSIEILKVMKNAPFKFSAAEISIKTGINRTTVHRILNTMVASEMVSKITDTNLYRIDHIAFEIGMAYKSAVDPDLEIRNVLRGIGKILGINVGYAVRKGKSVFSLHEINEFSEVHFGYVEGEEYPITRGVTGKTIMAYYEPRDEIEAYIKTLPIVKKTPHTPASHDKVIEDYKTIREMGYGFSDGESIQGFVGFATPVFDKNKTIHGCVSAVTIKEGLGIEKREKIIRLLKEAAEEISKMV